MSTLFYISLFLLIIVLLRFFIAVLNYITRPVLPKTKPTENPLVSVLIPARNEEDNIDRIINWLLAQTYTNIEIIIYNDQSTDNTSAIVQQYANKHKNIILIEGIELPKGWLGKNFGCHQLAQAANGDYLLYLDADVTVSPDFVENATAYIQRKQLALLSMFPRQQLQTFGEKMVVPSMNWILLSLLCLRFVKWSKRRSLAAANGQMMMFDAKIYKQNLWHEKLKSSPVEDIGISRIIKKNKLPIATLLGTNDISCRMYSSYSQAINGFTKNIAAFFGGSLFVMLVFVLIGTIAPIVVVLGLPFPLVFLYFFCLIASRLLISKLSEQSRLVNVFLWPLQHLALLHLAFMAIAHTRKKQLTWKGRNVANIN
ncbi:MAG: glycosyltransferase [Bacteroidales bacterium]